MPQSGVLATIAWSVETGVHPFKVIGLLRGLARRDISIPEVLARESLLPPRWFQVHHLKRKAPVLWET
jgi:hypothetical protein